MTTYVMEALEPYDETRATTIDAGGFSTPTCLDTFGLGGAYDATNRELVFSVIIDKSGTGGVITNTSGYTLWSGAVAVADGDDFPATVAGSSQASNWNYFIGRKNIDTGVVTFYDAYDSTKTVPAGIGGGDGTWRRFVSDTSDEGQNFPILTNPRNGDAWVHMESCELYQFRRADNYALTISPLIPAGNSLNPVVPITCDGEYVYATEIRNSSPGAKANLYLVPADYTAAEIAADEKLAYATYDLGSYWYSPNGSGTSLQYVATIDDDDNSWFFTNDLTGKGDFRLYKFTKPSAFTYPTPPSDGGMAEVSPWTSTQGPNIGALSGDSSNSSSHGLGRGFIAFSHSRTQLNLLSGTNYNRITSGTAADSNIVYTWYKPADASYGSTVLLQGYMDADLNTVSIGSAAYCLTGSFAQTNRYLDADNYYDAADYASRWFFVEVRDVDAGVLSSTYRWLLVKLTWNDGAVPTISTVVPERTTWDAAYTTYQAYVGSSLGAVRGSGWSFISFGGNSDFYLFDASQNAFYLSAKQASDSGNADRFFQFDADFSGRSGHAYADPPIMKLSMVEPAPPVTSKVTVWCAILPRAA